MDYVLRTKALKKTYGNYKALSGLSMNVPQGAIYGFIGKNGAGKTTLIRLICGLQDPTSGGYTLYGRENTDKEIAKSRRRMGAVVETPALYLDMTAADNLKQQYLILGLPSFDGLPEILKTVGLYDVGKKKVKHFSLGMRQRLGIAVALVGDPDFLVLDEPVNGLDPEGIVEMRELILKLNRERQITVLVSSHILDELSKLATYYGFIDNGRIVKEISAKERMNLEYAVLSDRMVDVYARVNISRLTFSLAEENCQVFSVQERDESLESYYINLIGGGNP